MRPVLKWSLIGCGCLGSGAVALFVGSIAVMVGLDVAGIRPLPTPAPKAIAVATIAPTALPPTAAPAPTARATVQPQATPIPTPVPPTPAPPTAIPATAAPPKPSGPSPETRAYLDWLRPNLEVAGQAMSGLATQSQLANQNPRLLTDGNWRMKTAVALGFMSNAGKEMQAYPGVVPPEAQKLNAMTKDLGKDLEYISAEYAAGIDQTSAARIGNAVTRMNGLPTKTQAATAEIRTLGSQ